MELAGNPRRGAAGSGTIEALTAHQALRGLVTSPVRHRPEPSRPEPGAYSSPKLLEPLSAREREVLIEVAGGWSNFEIGERLYISASTAKTHVSSLLTKLGAHGRAQLVMIAYETGLLTPAEPFHSRR